MQFRLFGIEPWAPGILKKPVEFWYVEKSANLSTLAMPVNPEIIIAFPLISRCSACTG